MQCFYMLVPDFQAASVLQVDVDRDTEKLYEKDNMWKHLWTEHPQIKVHDTRQRLVRVDLSCLRNG
jgi:hypothetical protein